MSQKTYEDSFSDRIDNLIDLSKRNGPKMKFSETSLTKPPLSSAGAKKEV